MRSADNTVFDGHSTCNVLHVSRDSEIDLKTWIAQVSTEVLAAKAGASLRKDPDQGWLSQGGYSEVIQCSWAKDTGGSPGAFTFTSKTRRNYLKIIKPGDLIFIFMDGEGSPEREDWASGVLLTVGIVDRIAESTSVGDGATSRAYTVNGRDLGVVFAETSTVFDRAWASVVQALFTGEFFSETMNKASRVDYSPPQHIWHLLRLFYDSEITKSAMLTTQWTMQGVNAGVTLTSLIDVTTHVQAPMFGFALGQGYDLAGAGNVLNLIRAWSNGVINECFFDVRDVTPESLKVVRHLEAVASKIVDISDYGPIRTHRAAMRQSKFFYAADETSSGAQVMSMVLRQLPYDKGAFESLEAHEVYETETFDTEFGRSAHDTFNMFRIQFPDLGDNYQELAYGLHVNPVSINLHGVRRLESETKYCFLSSKHAVSYEEGKAKSIPWTDLHKRYLSLLSTWYACNDRMLSGTVSLRFRPEIRCGTRLLLHKDGTIYAFYVQAVSHQFSTGFGESRTMLTVVRGVDTRKNELENNLTWPESPTDWPVVVLTPAELVQASTKTKPKAKPEAVPAAGDVETPEEAAQRAAILKRAKKILF